MELTPRHFIVCLTTVPFLKLFEIPTTVRSRISRARKIVHTSTPCERAYALWKKRKIWFFHGPCVPSVGFNHTHLTPVVAQFYLGG